MTEDDHVKHYDIGPINTLIDLNKDCTNFSADLSIETEVKDSPFKMAVVDQTIIDTGDIPFKEFSGVAGASVKWTKNTFKNHYIAIKSDKEQKVKVTIDLSELPHEPQLEKKQEKTLEKQHNQSKSHTIPSEEVEEKPIHYKKDVIEKFAFPEQKSIFSKTWFRVFIVACLLIVVILFFRNRKKNNVVEPVNVGEVDMRPRYKSRLNFYPYE